MGIISSGREVHEDDEVLFGFPCHADDGNTVCSTLRRLCAVKVRRREETPKPCRVAGGGGSVRFQRFPNLRQ